MDFKISKDLTSLSDQYELLMNTKEKLREVHNKQGADFREAKLTESQWTAWKSDYFDPRSAEVEKKLCELRESLRFSKKYSVDLDKDFV